MGLQIKTFTKRNVFMTITIKGFEEFEIAILEEKMDII